MFLHSSFSFISRYKLIFICREGEEKVDGQNAGLAVTCVLCCVWDVLCWRSQINIRAVGIQALSCLSGASLWSSGWVCVCRGPDTAASVPLCWAAPLACSEVSCVFICTISMVIIWYLNWGSSFLHDCLNTLFCAPWIKSQCSATQPLLRHLKNKEYLQCFFNLFWKIVASDVLWNTHW